MKDYFARCCAAEATPFLFPRKERGERNAWGATGSASFTSLYSAPCSARDFQRPRSWDILSQRAKFSSLKIYLKIPARFSSPDAPTARPFLGREIKALLKSPLMARRAVVRFPGHPAGMGRMSGIEAGMPNYRGLGKTVRRRGTPQAEPSRGVLFFGYFLGDKHQKVTRHQAEPELDETVLFNVLFV